MTGRVVNIHRVRGLPMGSIDIMRPGPLGNPYPVGAVWSRAEAISLHMHYARERMKRDPEWAALVRSLKGRTLVCICAPLPCHGDNYLVLCEEV